MTPRKPTRCPAPAHVPPGYCPGCGTAELTYGHTKCQACGLLDKLCGQVEGAR